MIAPTHEVGGAPLPHRWAHPGWRLAALIALAALALQIYFGLRIAAMMLIDPHSTAFQRSERLRLGSATTQVHWAQAWRDYERISPQLKRAVIAAEDAGFAEHSGVEWDALESAWSRNEREAARVAAANALIIGQAASKGQEPDPKRLRTVRVLGGSTITQQLAKNLFLSSERNLARKLQEILITMMLEAMLDKRRILEIYLNNVEWGQGVFGAQAAAQRYFGVDADRLSARAAARLAVMLPAPKRFELQPDSALVRGRAARVLAGMAEVDAP